MEPRLNGIPRSLCGMRPSVAPLLCVFLGKCRSSSTVTVCVEWPHQSTKSANFNRIVELSVFCGPAEWTSLPPAPRGNDLSLNAFNKKLKTHLFGQDDDECRCGVAVWRRDRRAYLLVTYWIADQKEDKVFTCSLRLQRREINMQFRILIFWWSGCITLVNYV